MPPTPHLSTLSLRSDGYYRAVFGLSALFFAICTWVSYVRWANFAYRTFDLAYYVQALWQLVHGRFAVSVQYVPLLGNHVEPIVFLIAPLFFFIRHPMLFVVLQNAALASMGPVAFRIAIRLGLTSREALWLSLALLVTPATGYVALHEFHPEALTAPFLLLMLGARVRGSLGGHWLWFLATLACKENMALLLTAYCLVQWVADRKSGRLLHWYVGPMCVAVLWFVLCSKVITPAFNSGNIDYGALYDRLGNSAGEILRNAITRPQLFMGALSESISHGNLVWALFLPFLFLPLLRPQWLVIASPIFLQHLLSWRSSEWNIYFHYAAPLLPLLWFASAEAISRVKEKRLRIAMPIGVLAACLVLQGALGPVREMVESTTDWVRLKPERSRKNTFLAAIPAQASVTAPLPYLSHLALREELHSLHYILKGLKTLSRQPFIPPPPTEFVLIDYNDTATFDRKAGYYHPKMRTVEGQIISSSDLLLHNFLKDRTWTVRAVDELTLLQQGQRAEEGPVAADPIWGNETQAQLLSIATSAERIATTDRLEIVMDWRLQESRTIFPWLELRLINGAGSSLTLVRGLCAPEAKGGSYSERWQIRPGVIPSGTYQASAVFFDNTKREMLAQPVSLGSLTVLSSR